MNYSNIINQIIVLFLLMGVGFISGKVKIITPEINLGLSKLLLNVTMPFMIINAFNFEFSNDMLKTAGIVFVISMFVHGALTILGLFLFKRQDDGVQRVFRFITIFSNCGFIGYPVAGSIYGSEGIFYAAIFNVGYNIFVWTVGVMIFKKDGMSVRKAFINPGIIAVIIGFILFIFPIKLPFPIMNTMELIGDMTVPLSMLIVGASICSTNLKDAFKEWKYYYASTLRLIVIPLAVYGVLKLIGFEGIILGVPLIVSAMPAAANTVTFAQIYEGDVECASKITVVSTLLASITLPLMMLLLN